MICSRHLLRLRGLLLAVVYLAVPAGVLGVRPCEHHDAVDAPRAEATGDHHAHGPDHSHAHNSADAQPADHNGCDCLGACSPAPLPALPHATAAASGAVPVAVSAAALSVGEADAAPAHLHPYVLPWPVGPPVHVH
jgi:hypothetical protein